MNICLSHIDRLPSQAIDNMAEPIEDEDAYLYGSEDEQPSRKRKLDDDEDAGDSKRNSASAELAGVAPADGEHEDDDDDDESGSESGSDSDIEFVIGESAPKTTTTAASSTTTSAPTGGATESTDANTTTIVAKDQPKLDINGVAELDGKPLTQVDLETLANKPWRIPGLDISDYFNYGFDEFTWTAYCCKQDKLRGEFNPQKVMAQLLGNGKGGPPMPPMGMPMPPMPMGMPMPPMPPMPRRR